LFAGKVLTNFNFSKEAVYKKLKTVLKEKKKQHKDSGFDNKIIFLDSESITEFYFGLFADNRIYDKYEIERVCQVLHLKCIVCITIRDYRGENPFLFAHVISPEEYQAEAAQLMKIFPNVISSVLEI
jgi:hypothetical protein